MDKGRIIAWGTPKAFIETYFQEDALEFVHPALTTEEIDKLSRLSHVTRQSLLPRGVILLYTQKTVKTLNEPMQYMKGLGKSIDRLNVRRPTLEDLFLSLTGRKVQG